jgi:hypothetical protein
VTQVGSQAGCVFSSEEAIGVIKKIGSRRGRLMCWIRCAVSLFLTFLTVPPLPSFSSSFPFPFLLLPVSSQSSLLLPLPPLFLPLAFLRFAPISLFYSLQKTNAKHSTEYLPNTTTSATRSSPRTLRMPRRCSNRRRGMRGHICEFFFRFFFFWHISRERRARGRGLFFLSFSHSHRFCVSICLLSLFLH